MNYGFALVGGVISDNLLGHFKVLVNGCLMIVIGIILILASDFIQWKVSSSVRIPICITGM